MLEFFHNGAGSLYNWFLTPAARLLHSYLNSWGERAIEGTGLAHSKFSTCLPSLSHRLKDEMKNGRNWAQWKRETSHSTLLYLFFYFRLHCLVLELLNPITRKRELCMYPCFIVKAWSGALWFKETTEQIFRLFCPVPPLCQLLNNTSLPAPVLLFLSALAITIVSFLFQCLTRGSPSGVSPHTHSVCYGEQMTSCKLEKGNKGKWIDLWLIISYKSVRLAWGQSLDKAWHPGVKRQWESANLSSWLSQA